MTKQKPLVVQKFGGTSVGSLHLISQIARSVATESTNKRIVLVLSAMAGETNKAVSCCLSVSQLETKAELASYDAAISSCENFSASIMALAINAHGKQAIALQGWQVPIVTDDSFSNAKIREVGVEKLLKYLNEGIVPVVCGFQGINKDGLITTLGRGGSDTTASAIAAALKAECCEIYTDVDGVFSSDPRLVPQASLITEISYEEMFCLASCGAKVLERRSVAIAMQNKVLLKVINSNTSCSGTRLIEKKDKQMETPQVSAISLKNDVAFCKIESEHILKLINVISELTITNLRINCKFGSASFEIPLTEGKQLERLLQKNKALLKSSEIDTTSAYVSAVGWHLNQNSQFLKEITSFMKERNVLAIFVEDHCIKIKTPLQNAAQLVKALHAEFIEKH